MTNVPQEGMDTAPRPRALLGKVRVTIRDLALSGAIGIVLIWFLPSWIRCVSLYIGAFIFLANVICTLLTDWKPKGRISIDGKAVVISGCTNGFGYMLAKRLDKLGFQVFAGCLRPDGDEAKKLKQSSSDKLHILKMDVTKEEDVQESLAYVTENLSNNKLWAVVCNAGMNDGGEINWTDMDTIRNVLDVNLFGVIRMAKAFLPEICKSKGRVVAVGSAAGRFTAPGIIPYSMSKHGVVSFCDGLRLEMGYRFGVEVVLVEPTFYRTNLIEESRVLGYLTKTWDKAPDKIKQLYPEEYLRLVVDSAMKALKYSVSERPQDVITCLEEAITAKYPKHVYSPGTLYSRVSLWFVQRLPKPIADILLLDAFTAKFNRQ